MVASIKYPSSSRSRASASNSLPSTPACDQRENRVYTDCHGPYALGKSRQGAPVRSTQSIASTIARCGLAFRPPVFVSGGKRAATVAHCLSLSRTTRSIHHWTALGLVKFTICVACFLFFVQFPQSAFRSAFRRVPLAPSFEDSP